MKLHAIQLGQLEVSQGGREPLRLVAEGSEETVPMVRVSRVPGPVHHILAMNVYNATQRLALATLVGLA